MKLSNFEIKILRQHWILDDGNDDKNDLCSHGEVYIRIGTEELSNKASGSWSLSTAGLFLLRSLDQDCKRDEFSNHIVPCCGHSIYPSENGENRALILGCGHGVDWQISHLDDSVVFETLNGSKAKLPFDEYRVAVLGFTNEIEKFYGDPDDKVVPDDKYDRDGFNQFWAEWKELKGKWSYVW